MWTPCMEPRVVPTLHKHFRSLRSTAGACERHCGPPVGPWGPPLPGWVNIDAEGRWRRPGLQGGGSVQGSCGVAARDPGLGCVAALRLRSRWELWAETGAVGPAWVPSQPTLSVDFFSLQNPMGELKNQSFIKPRVGPLLVRGHVSSVDKCEFKFPPFWAWPPPPCKSLSLAGGSRLCRVEANPGPDEHDVSEAGDGGSWRVPRFTWPSLPSGAS